MVFQHLPVLLSEETVIRSKADPLGVLTLTGVPTPSLRLT